LEPTLNICKTLLINTMILFQIK